jgi:hypothetical protein
MQPISVTVGPLDAADDNGIALSQTTAGAANLTLNGALVSGGVATLDSPRQIAITSAGNDTGITFTIYGTTYGDQSVSETITGASGAASTTNTDFLTVTRIAASGATSASGVIAGTNSKAGSRWVRLDSWAFPQTAIQVNASGTVNWTLQVTMDDPNSPTNPVAVSAVQWLNTNDPDAVSAVGDVFSNFDWTPTWSRILLNSGTGSVTATFAQFNVVSK